MNLFSISQLAQFSGIKPHTIRIWEQRYDALKPSRSEGNTRYYDGSQLRRLLNIVSLMDHGLKVSQLCSMSDENLFLLIQNSGNSQTSESSEYYISQLISAGMSYNQAYFEHVFTMCLLDHGMTLAYKQVLYPMMDRIGLMWASDAIPAAHEHFISNIISRKLSAAIDSTPLPDPGSETWLLFLPENEFHEIGLLFAYYMIRLSGRKVFYLGSNVPMESVYAAINDTKPQNLLLFLVHYDLPDQIQKSLNRLNSYFSGSNIYLAGNQKLLSQLNYFDKIRSLYTIDSLDLILQSTENSKFRSTI